MTEIPQNAENAPSGQAARAGEQRVVYVVQQDPSVAHADEIIELATIVDAAWHGKWWIAGITALISLLSLVYVFTATPWYRAEVLLAPASTTRPADGLASQLGVLGGLASLAGVDIGGNTSEPLAVLQSREFSSAFIEENDLLPILFARDWDPASRHWKAKDPEDWPDVRDGVKYFNEKIRSVQQDKKTGLIVLSVEWKNAEVAADWANKMVERANERIRERALVEAQTNVSYLQRELASATVVTLQQSIGRLLDTELQKLMLARGKKEFAFRVVDRAIPPKIRSWPKRLQVVVVATALGGVLSVLFVLSRGVLRPRRGAVHSSDQPIG